MFIERSLNTIGTTPAGSDVYFLLVKDYSSSPKLVGNEINDPKNKAFKNILFVPYQVPRKFGLSENRITLPCPSGENNTAAELATLLMSVL